MSGKYFGLVNTEFNKIGLEGPTLMECHSWPPKQWNYLSVLQLIDRTYMHNDALSDTGRRHSSDVDTYPAIQAAKILDYGQRPDKVRYHACCSGAEYKLVDSLNDKAVANARFTSPLILTKGDLPVGIIKGFGEDSFYGLVDDPEYGIVKGAFATPVNRNDMRQVPQSDHAWRAPIEALGRVIPLRLSLLTIPLEERLRLVEEAEDEDDRICLGTSHEDINEATERFLVDASVMERVTL